MSEFTRYDVYLYGLPTDERVGLIPLEITDEAHDLYYDKVTIQLCIVIAFIEVLTYYYV